MNAVNIAPYTKKECSFEASAEGKSITIRLTGISDMNATQELEQALVQVHAEARRLGVEEVTVDFRRLEFMNSSCFKSFVSWVSSVQELEPPRQYRIRFLSSRQYHWQQRSLHALRCFADELITIEDQLG